MCTAYGTLCKCPLHSDWTPFSSDRKVATSRCAVWLKSLSKHQRRTIGEDIAYVQFKWPIGKPRVDHLRGPIWEIRSTLDNRIARTLFAVEKGRMLLLHAFVKKTQRTPESDVELALKRFKEWQRGET